MKCLGRWSKVGRLWCKTDYKTDARVHGVRLLFKDRAPIHQPLADSRTNWVCNGSLALASLRAPCLRAVDASRCRACPLLRACVAAALPCARCAQHFCDLGDSLSDTWGIRRCRLVNEHVGH